MVHAYGVFSRYAYVCATIDGFKVRGTLRAVFNGVRLNVFGRCIHRRPLRDCGSWATRNPSLCRAHYRRALTLSTEYGTMAYKYATREDWLNGFIEASRAKFDEINAPLPVNVRVAVGFTSRGMKGTRIGECWSDTASEDGHFEIFIKPTLDGEARICDVLTHELAHAAAGLDKGHGPHFKRVATSLGLGGKMTATVAGPEWYAWALPIIDALGPMPYGALKGGMSTGRPKQKTALLKVECPVCGWLARVTAKHIDTHAHLNCPVPDCVGVLVTE